MPVLSQPDDAWTGEHGYVQVMIMFTLLSSYHLILVLYVTRQ